MIYLIKSLHKPKSVSSFEKYLDIKHDELIAFSYYFSNYHFWNKCFYKVIFLTFILKDQVSKDALDTDDIFHNLLKT